MTMRPLAGALLGASLSVALAFVGAPRAAAQEAPPPEVEAFVDSEAEHGNLWWFPGVLGVVTAAVSVSGFVNVRAELHTLRDERVQAELCAASPGSPACRDLGPYGRAVLESGAEDVCSMETAMAFGIADICEHRNRNRTRKKVYLTVGTLGLAVGLGSFIAYGLLARRDAANERAALVTPWLSLGAERSAGLALDLTF